MIIGAPISPNNIVEQEALQEFQTFRIGELPKDRVPVMETELELKVGETCVVDQNLADYPSGYSVQSVSSKNQVAATVEGQTIKANRVGTAEISVEFVDADGNLASGVIHLNVKKEIDENAGMYQIEDGKLVIDTADALENSEYAKAEKGRDYAGADATVHYWELSENGMICLPDTADAQKWIADKWILAPRLRFTIKVTEETAGDYVLYINRTSKEAASDSYYVALNDTLLGQYADDQMVVDRWDSFRERLDMSEPGVYTLDVYAREDGISINQLVISKEVEIPVGYQTPTDRTLKTDDIPEKKEIPEMLADFTFDDEETGFVSENAAASGEYMLQYHNGGKALYLNGTSNYLEVTAKDGSSLLTGVSEMTVSFLAKPDSNDFNWLFYASRNADTQVFESENYLGIIDKSGTIITERYMNAGGRPTSAQAATGTSNWYYVTVVYTEEDTTIYINGEQKAKQASNFSVSGVLGSDSILYIGKANWGTGEYYKGLIDNYRIRSKALTREEVAAEAMEYYANGDHQVTISNLKLESAPAKTEYKIGEDLDLTGMKVTATLPGGAVADVTEYCEVAGYDNTKTGTQKISIIFVSRTVNFEVTVKEETILDDPKLPYEDVTETDWFYEAVAYTYVEGLMTGMDATHFGPYGQLSRAQFALILYRMEDTPVVDTDKTFGDIVGDEWYGPAVLWAAENGIVTGYQSGNFGPADMITREQMAVMMYRYAYYISQCEAHPFRDAGTVKYLGEDVTADGTFDTFVDSESVSGFAAEAMQWAVGGGIITGKENGTKLDPQGNTARAEAAVIIQRFMK